MESTTKTLYKLKGFAPEPNNLQSVAISGAIDSVSNYLVKIGLTGQEHYDPKYSVIIVCDRSIEFKGNYNQVFNLSVKGSFKPNPLISDLGINADRMYLPKELEKKLRFLKNLFVNDSDYANVISRLKQVSIKTNGIVQNETTTNKNKALIEREHDFKPIEFVLKMKLFEGEKKESTFPCSIYADVTDAGAKLWIEAIDLNSIIDQQATELIAAEIKKLESFAFPIINA